MKWLPKTIASIPINYPIIIVDNNSQDKTISYLKETQPEIHLIENENNLGFGAANNLGMSYALKNDCDSVFLLNQDAFVVDDALFKLIEFQKSNLEYGILSPVHLNGTKDALDFNFSNYVARRNCPKFYSDHVLGENLKSVYDVSFINAAAWLISKECLKKVGGFDPIFFHYSEDNNYCQRVLFHDFKIGVIPKCFIIHDRKQTGQEQLVEYSPKYFQWQERVYKTKIADVNNTKPIDIIAEEKNILKSSFIRALLAFRVKSMKGLIKQYNLLKSLEDSMLKSYKNNQIPKMHYLDVEEKVN